MSRKIWKFEVELKGGTQTLAVPSGGRIVAFAKQGVDVGEGLVFWAEVDPDATKVGRDVQVVGTGHEVPEGFVWRGMTLDGPYVWHLYEKA